MVVYVKEQGSRIVREGRHLLVKKGPATCHTLFTYKLDQLCLFGSVEVTNPARSWLLREGVDTVFFTRSGRYLGRMVPEESKNVFLRRRQFALLEDDAASLRVARAIVGGKCANMATLLMRLQRAKGLRVALESARKIRNLARTLAGARDMDALRGYEGRATAWYFEGLRGGFTGRWDFTRRVRRPPTDPVNAVLSLVYTFLMNRVYGAVRMAGLDPYPGFLHAPDYGRYSLVLDLMEEFRTIIADTLALSLFNLKILQPADFLVENPPPPRHAEGLAGIPDVAADPIGQMQWIEPDQELRDLPEQRMDEGQAPQEESTGKPPVRLAPEAFVRVIESFERKLATRFRHPMEDRQVSYADALLVQARHMRKVVEGEADAYQPLLLK